MPPARSRRHRARRLAATAAVGAALALAPGAAAAAPNRSGPPDVVPLVDCVTEHADGSWTAVFGYDNRTGSVVEIPVGPANQVTPPSSGQPQPTTFRAGVVHGAFRVTVERGGGPMWHLGRDDLAARKADTACPPTVQLPADGNGTGVLFGAAAATIAGAVLLHRHRERGDRTPAPGSRSA
ncbi:hypothetical protein [Blastococcus sp. SYSU D00813]